MGVRFVEAQGRAFLKQAVLLIGNGKSEDILRHTLSAKLSLMFPDEPWWAKAHVTGTEAHTRFYERGGKKHGFVDVLVGATVIEYEPNLRAAGAFDHGLHQVKQYLAGRLNAGARRELLIGVLSDTVRWHAFGIKEVKEVSAVLGATAYGPDHVELHEIESCDLSAAGIVEARRLGAFLVRYLGREGGRELSASTLASDLGFDSSFCGEHLKSLNLLVERAFSDKPDYAKLIAGLWMDFVSYLGGDNASSKFDKGSYVGELYILTLAKLICANVLAGKALISDDDEVRAVLGGGFFRAKGLPNVVEYDYFGWLSEDPYLTELVAVAREMQADLRAYDFVSTPAEDVFGEIMAQMAGRSQRVLLGQEWTPSWLAAILVQRVMDSLPKGAAPRFVDVCCGSGAMVVETVKCAQRRLRTLGIKPGDPSALSELTTSITAFDIDPLAVMLSKVGWVLASREWLAAGQEVQIPVYHADSLFANTPVTRIFSASGDEQRRLRLDTEELSIPPGLIEQGNQPLFDALLSRGYEMAMSSAAAVTTTLEDADVESLVDSGVDETGVALRTGERAACVEFFKKLLHILEKLQRAGRNGIWAFVLRNSFRPALVAGRFNGMVANPPWLALSRIASNPYRSALKEKADSYGIKAPGASHLHAEIATTFLLNAIDRYLAPGAGVGCVLPDTVLNGAHHEPFRSAGYLAAARPVQFAPSEIWKVASQTFKTEAIVLFGTKSKSGGKVLFHGKEVSRVAMTAMSFHVVRSHGRTAWTPTRPAGHSGTVARNQSIGRLFRQGADVMPRGIVFHAVARAGRGWNLGPIVSGSRFYFLRSDGHRLKEFKLDVQGVSDKVLLDVLISKHLAPFELAPGAKGLLPFRHGSGGWEARTEPGIAALGASTAAAVREALKAVGQTAEQFFEAVDTERRKLTGQAWSGSDWLVLAAAGGKFPCAAYVRGGEVPCGTTIIDQTLYWARVSTEDEAVYIAALINSPAAREVIREHQPRGAFGERHIHKLAFDRTPAFDPLDVKHAAVVRSAKALLGQWASRRTAPDIQPMLAAEKHLVTRRTAIRSALEALPAWTAYAKACATLYGV